MLIFDRMESNDEWMAFYEHKIQQSSGLNKRWCDLLSFIESKKYLYYTELLKSGGKFSPPQKLLINKSAVGRKRTVYSFSREETYILGMISYLLKDYDCLFAPNLYSFRKSKTAKKAFETILCIPELKNKHIYRSDISNYFNSINIDKLLPQLKETLKDDLPLFNFLKSLLTDDRAIFNDETVYESKGIIPGSPPSAFLANLYLYDMDYMFYEKGIHYIRYSDDIFIASDNENSLREHISLFHEFISSRDLEINPEKEKIYSPGSKWEFLGFSYQNGSIDISEVSLKKIKSKLKRKTKALKRWADKRNLPGIYAAKALIKRFNNKFYNNPVYNELTWSRWYFPVITTAETLKSIDRYETDCIRYLVSGRHTKKKYDVTYEDIKALGYRNLVNEYYKFQKTDE